MAPGLLLWPSPGPGCPQPAPRLLPAALSSRAPGEPGAALAPRIGCGGGWLWCGGFLKPGPGPGPGPLLLLLLCLPLTEVRTRQVPCDNGKFKLQVDLPPVEEFICRGPTWALPETVIPSVANVYPEQEAARVCMGERIEYNKRIPNSGRHRPNSAMYGEYLYVPPQRWVHNLQHGGIAFLYHPCVHPRLKEELSLLARACMYKHIITPHLNLSEERPLALVAWGKSLEMSKINLAEAVNWLRRSVNRAPDSEMKDDGVYNYLLIWKAKLGSDNSDRVVCPGNRMKKVQRHFKRSDLQLETTKWNKAGENRLSNGLLNGHVILRRRRNTESREPAQTSKQVAEVASSRISVQRTKQDNDSASAMTLSSGQPAVARRQPPATTVAAVIAGGPEQAPESKTNARQETKKGNYEIGGEQNGNKIESESKLWKEVTISTLKQPPVSEAHQHSLLNSNATKQLKTGSLAVKQNNSHQHHQTHNTSDSSLDSQVKAHQTNSEDNPPLEQIKSGGRIIGKANNQMAETPAIKEQQIAKIIANTNYVLDRQGLSGETDQMLKTESTVSGENVKPLQPRQNSAISSKNDTGTKQDEGTDESYTGEMGSDRSVQKVDAVSSKTNETVSQNAQDNRNNNVTVDSGNVKCKCEAGAFPNVQTAPEGGDSNNLKAGALQKTQHHPEDRTLYLPTPRTEEAAWAAAALTFLFVFLTVAVLYTRLYRKFIKSDSLYWAPFPGIDGQESVADIIKRRLIRFGKRRKKKPPSRKKPISPYDVVPSDNSD